MSIRARLAKAGAVLEGEFFFALKSARVAIQYINMDPAFTDPRLVDELGELLTAGIEQDFDVIAGPAIGAIPLAYAAERNLNADGIRIVWAEKGADGSFAFVRAGFAETVRKKRVLVVEDVTTTGDSAKAVGDLVKQHDGSVVAYSFIWNRGGVTAKKMDAPIYALITEQIPSWKPGEHEMWGTWPLVENIGHPEHFPDYPGKRISL